MKLVCTTSAVFAVALLYGSTAAAQQDGEAPSPSEATSRTWSDMSGKHRIDAVFIDFQDGKVKLRKSNGSTVSVSIGKLSREDQLWIREKLRRRRAAGDAGSDADQDAKSSDARQLSRAWPQWLGPNRNGHTSEPSGNWPPKQLWQKQIGADSGSSPILVNGRIYVTTLSGNQTSVQCLDARTGDVIWQGTTPGGKYGRYSEGDKSYYGGPLSTPACDGHLLFTVSVDGDLQCWDAAGGEKKWGGNLYDRYQMGRRKHNRDYGYTTSPMLLGENVVVEVGGTKGAIMAFDKSTGKETGAWGQGQVGHSSGPAGPQGRVFFGLSHLWIGSQAIDWRTDFACNIATPAVSGDYVICTSAYNMSRTTCFENGREKWTSRYHDKARSPVIHAKTGNVYLPQSGKCLSLATGKRLWDFRESTNIVVTSDDKLVLFGSEIRLYDPAGKQLSKVRSLRPGWNSGAFGEGLLVFRAGDTVVCYSVQ